MKTVLKCAMVLVFGTLLFCAEDDGDDSATMELPPQVFMVAFQYGNLPEPTYTLCTDTYIRSGAFSDSNFSTRTSLAVGRNPDSTYSRILLHFNTDNYIPQDARVEAAYLYVNSTLNRLSIGVATIDVNALSLFHDASTVVWRSGMPWTNAGGDFAPQAIETAITGGAAFFSVKLDSAAVQRWVIGGQNLGVIIKAVNESALAPNKLALFESSEVATATLRPKLVIYYSLP